MNLFVSRSTSLIFDIHWFIYNMGRYLEMRHGYMSLAVEKSISQHCMHVEIFRVRLFWLLSFICISLYEICEDGVYRATSNDPRNLEVQNTSCLVLSHLITLPFSLSLSLSLLHPCNPHPFYCCREKEKRIPPPERRRCRSS